MVLDDIKSRLDTSGLYYNWLIFKTHTGNRMQDAKTKADENISTVNCTVKKWAMSARELGGKLFLYTEQSWASRKVREALGNMSDEYKVYGYTMLSCLFFALCSLFTDLISEMPIVEILWWRFFFTLGLTTLLNVYKGHPSPFSYPNANMILLTAVLGTMTAISTVFALRHLPIGEATLLLTTAPIFTVILSNVFLKEKLLVWDVIALIIATGGVFFVAQPSFIFGSDDGLVNKQPVFYISIVVALGRGFFKAAKYVSVSCAGVDVPTSVIVMCLSSLGFLVSTLFLIVSVCVEQITDKDMHKTWIHPSLLNFTYLWLVGAMYCAQQLTVCAAMQYGQPGKTSLLKYMDVILPFAFQFVIFREYPNQWTLVGCGCIAISTITVMLVKRVKPIKHVQFEDDVVEMEAVEVHKLQDKEEAVESGPPRGELKLQEN